MSMNELKVANKKDVWHLVTRGIVTQLHFDFEAYSLNTSFAQIMGYGDARGDIAGNFDDELEIEVKRPDRYVPGPQALAVTRTSFTELNDDSRMKHPQAMAKMAKRFEDSPLAAMKFCVEEDKERPIASYRKNGETLYPVNKDIKTFHMPLFDETRATEFDADGNIVTDPAGMLSLNDKGEICIGPEKKVVKIPKTTMLEQPDGSLVRSTVFRPMKPEDGRITFDVRIHPGQNRIAYRADSDPSSPYYENIENLFYTDGKASEDAYEADDVTEERWKFTMPRLLVSGYRIKWYDIAVLRANLVRAGYHPSNIFFTHSKATISNKELPKNMAVDGFLIGMDTHLFGPQGEDGLLIGERDDQRSGEKVPSAKLELLMENNTRYENKKRRLREGVRMPDGSIYDARKGHKSPAYDSKASFSMYNYCRELAPDVVKLVEMQGDEDFLREFLPANDLTEDHKPIYAIMRNSYPNQPMADAMAFLGFDDQQGQLRRAITMRLDGVDLQRYTYKGKTLLQMAREDLSQRDPTQRNFVRMLREQGRDPDSLIRVDGIRKWPGVMPIENVLHTESARNWDLDTIDQNYSYIAEEHNGDILEAIRDAVEILNWELRQKEPEPNAMMEEEAVFNGFGDLDVMEYDAREEIVKAKRLPVKTQTKGVTQMIFESATDIFKYQNAIDEFMHRLVIQPQPVDNWQDCQSDEELRDVIQNYWDNFKKVRSRLREKGSPYVHIFEQFREDDGNIYAPGAVRRVVIGEKEDPKSYDKLMRVNLEEMDTEQLQTVARLIEDFRWTSMRRILTDDENERNDKRSEFCNGIFDQKYAKKGRLLLGNLSRDFRVIDATGREQGRELSIEYIKQNYSHQPHAVQQKFEKGEWRIQFYRMRSEPSATAILMKHADMDRLDELDPLWQFRYKMLRDLYLAGPPNEDPSNMRWEAIPVLEKALLALEVNQPIEYKGSLARVFSNYVAGEAEVFLRSEEGQVFLADYRRQLEKVKKTVGKEGNFATATGYDEETGLARDWIKHKIPAESHIVVEVPDTHLREPLQDLRHTPYSLVNKSLTKDEKAKIRTGTPVVLKGMQTGRMYYPDKVNVNKAPSDENVSYSDYFEMAQRAYEDNAGVKFPAKKRDIMRIGKLMPIANSRRVDALDQSFKIPSLHFDGLVCPRLAYFKKDEPLTGLVLPADYCPQKITEGKPIRFREMLADMGSKMDGKEGLETGHTYTTTLNKARRMTVGELYTEVCDGTFTDEMARRCGYAAAYDMWEKVNSAFLDRESPSVEDEEILVLDFKPVDKDSWAFFDPPHRPQASFVYNGEHPSPSAYRTHIPSNDNDGVQDKPKKKSGSKPRLK
ncbi:MAG TPA: hypothetical protein EYG18_00995 [Micavibrio sp.]|nr:hypothetical protein [Micavibrio sp.]